MAMAATAPPLIDNENYAPYIPIPPPPLYPVPAPSAPEFNDIEEEIENAFDDVDLALITLEIEDLISDIQNEINIIDNRDKIECDDQCEKANNRVEQNTVDGFLKEKIIQIFNK